LLACAAGLLLHHQGFEPLLHKTEKSDASGLVQRSRAVRQLRLVA
jgi:hypothetical protein